MNQSMCTLSIRLTGSRCGIDVAAAAILAAKFLVLPVPFAALLPAYLTRLGRKQRNLVPTLCVGTHGWTLCVHTMQYAKGDAERRNLRPHAERGHEEARACEKCGLARVTLRPPFFHDRNTP